MKRNPLPNPFTETKIPKELLKEIQKLYGPRPGAFVRQIFSAWLVITASISFAVFLNTWWITIIAIFIIASRQNILGLLVHDQSHRLGIPGPIGDILTNIFAAYPLILFSVEGYAKTHLTHHKYYFTEEDPDHLRKQGPEWETPMSKWSLFTWFMRDAFGINMLKMIHGKNTRINSPEFKRAKPTPKYVRIIFLIALTGLLSVSGAWKYFALYWVVPLITVLPMIIRWGALTEHIYNTAGASIEENSPLIIPGKFEKILLPNLNFSFHPYHHWYPVVSFTQLPKVHELYVKNGLVDESKIFHGHLSFLRFITNTVSTSHLPEP